VAVKAPKVTKKKQEKRNVEKPASIFLEAPGEALKAPLKKRKKNRKKKTGIHLLRGSWGGVEGPAQGLGFRV